MKKSIVIKTISGETEYKKEFTSLKDAITHVKKEKKELLEEVKNKTKFRITKKF